MTDDDRLAILDDGYYTVENRSDAEIEASEMFDDYTATRLRSERMIEQWNRRRPKPEPEPPPRKLDTMPLHQWNAWIDRRADGRVAAALQAVLGADGWLADALGRIVAHERLEMEKHVRKRERALRRELQAAYVRIKQLEIHSGASE